MAHEIPIPHYRNYFLSLRSDDAKHALKKMSENV